MKSNGSGQEVSEKKVSAFTRLLIPTEDKKNGAEGGFLVFLFLPLSSVSRCVAGCNIYSFVLYTYTLRNNLVSSIYGLRTLDPVRN